MNSKLKIKNSKFNASLALLCVRASGRAYTSATDSEPSTDTHYLILELPHRIIVAFRGTASLQDFISDAHFFTTRININFDERVHLGFYRAYKSIENRLKSRLDEILTRRSLSTQNLRLKIKNSVPIVFTGHSLGGALALLATFYLHHSYNIEATYTFGAPDIGNAPFAARYNNMECGGKRSATPLSHITSTLHTRTLTTENSHDLPSASRPRTAPVPRCSTAPRSTTTESLAAYPPQTIPVANDHPTSLGQKTFCLGNACDPIPWLPPYRFGYRRVGKFLFLPGVTWLRAGFHLPLAARLIAGAIQVLRNWRHGQLALLPNHSLKLYATRVEQLVPPGPRLSPGAAPTTPPTITENSSHHPLRIPSLPSPSVFTRVHPWLKK